MAQISDFFLGTKDKTQQFSNLNPQQLQSLQSLLGQLMGPLSQGFGNINQILSGDAQAFQSFEKPMIRQFQEQILPQISEGFGGLGAGSSSGAQQTFARAGERLSENLAAQRGSMQQDAMKQLLSALGIGLSPTNETLFMPGRPGALHSLFQGGGQALGMLPFLL